MLALRSSWGPLGFRGYKYCRLLSVCSSSHDKFEKKLTADVKIFFFLNQKTQEVKKNALSSTNNVQIFGGLPFSSKQAYKKCYSYNDDDESDFLKSEFIPSCVETAL